MSDTHTLWSEGREERGEGGRGKDGKRGIYIATETNVGREREGFLPATNHRLRYLHAAASSHSWTPSYNYYSR
jgi:hypothetical protein